MATRITANGQLTVPKLMRESLQLAPGDLVEFQLNGNGEVVLRKAAVQPRQRTEHVHLDEQMRRRAEELTELLRGLD
jgi:antitoxin PrlF